MIRQENSQASRARMSSTDCAAPGSGVSRRGWGRRRTRRKEGEYRKLSNLVFCALLVRL